MLLSQIFDFINKYWMYILFLFVIISSLSLLIFIIRLNLPYKSKSFKEDLNEIKSHNMAVTVDLNEKVVEKYYLYDQLHKYEVTSLDEFYVRFDQQNKKRIKEWLEGIAKATSFTKTRRIEVVMYDKNNKRAVYSVELEGYNKETKKHYLVFKDVTETLEMARRIDKKPVLRDSDEFYRKAMERLSVTDDNSNNFLVAFKFKEYSFAEKELKATLIEAIEESIYHKVYDLILENELLCATANGTLLLFSPNIVNIKKYRKHIRSILFKCSGNYEFRHNKFEYTVTLVAGYTKINKNDTITIDKTLEAETAVNSIISKGRFSDRLQLFDDHLKNAYNLMNNKLLAVEKVITQKLFSVLYEPIINTKNKAVSGYYIKIILPQALHMNFNEFMSLVKQRFFRTAFYQSIFNDVLMHKDAKKKPFYLSFDYDNLTKVMEAYRQTPEASEVKFYLCMEFSSTTMQNTDLLSIEKRLTAYQNHYGVKFGITYNSLTTIYLNAKIYSKASVVLLIGQLVDHSLDKYSNASLIDIYINVANEYNQEVIGLSVKSLAIYELFSHYKIKKVGGNYIRPYALEGKITDKAILKNLSEIENRNY